MTIKINGHQAICTYPNGGNKIINFGFKGKKVIFDNSVNYDLRSRIRKKLINEKA